MIVQGANDVIRASCPGQEVSEVLGEASRAPVVYSELPVAQHGFESVSSTRTAHTVSAIERFLAYSRASAAARDQADEVLHPQAN